MNIFPLLGMTDEELAKLNTRHLLAAYRRTHGPFYTCGCYYHCGDECLHPEERETNRLVRELHTQLKPILDQRPHVSTSAESKARTVRRDGRGEKKQMEYRK